MCIQTIYVVVQNREDWVKQREDDGSFLERAQVIAVINISYVLLYCDYKITVT